MFKLDGLSVRGWAALPVLTLLATLATPVSAGFDERRTFDGDELLLRNLIGEVRVEGHGGSAFEVQVRVDGKDASTDRIRLQADEGRRATLSILFPVEESRHYVYPRLGNNSRTSFSPDDSNVSWLGALFGRDRIEVRGSGRGLEVWADVTVRVPRGRTLNVLLGVGQIEARNVEGELSLGTRSGPVDAEDIRGALLVDTGSGHVTVMQVDGNLSIDTGSGHVQAEDCDGESVHVDTGSGHVELDSIRTSKLAVDTGSGHVTARSISADSADIDTGSGSVTLFLDRMGDGLFRIDTGSGAINLRIPEGASADVEAETGSGGIQLDVEGIRLSHKERDEASFRIGSGDARIRLDTGSGRIRISH